MATDHTPAGSRLVPLDEAVPPRTRALTQAIRDAHTLAGMPSFRALSERNARAGRGVLSKATLSRIFSPNPRSSESLPEWIYYEGLLRVLQVNPAEQHTTWEAARQEWRTRLAGPDPVGSGDPLPRRPRRWRLLLIAATIVLLAFVVVLATGATSFTIWPTPQRPVPAANAVPDHRMDNTDPTATGCTPELDEQTYYSHLYYDWPTDTRRSDTEITMHYSVKCRTVWAALTNAPPSTQATLHRNNDTTEQHCTAGPDGSCQTRQLSDIGVTTHAFARTTTGCYGQTRNK